jgi:hypothetical protein
MSDLPADVRDRAALAAKQAFFNNHYAAWLHVVDAVLAAVRPAIERDAEARVEALEKALSGLLAPGVHGDFIAAAAANARAVLSAGTTESGEDSIENIRNWPREPAVSKVTHEDVFGTTENNPKELPNV